MKKRILSIILALALALSLGACGKKDADPGTDGTLAVNLADQPSPDVDPAGFLRFNIGNTAARLAGRHALSPLAAIARSAAQSGQLRFDMDSMTGFDAQIGGTLTYDATASELRLDASAASGENALSASAYVGPDFVGVASEDLFGDGLFYGFTPYGLTEQVSSGAFAGYMTEEYMEALKALDQVLEERRSAQIPDTDQIAAQYEQMFEELIDSMDLTGQEATAQLDGEAVDGYMITGSLDGEALAGLMERHSDQVFTAADTASRLAALMGAGARAEDMRAGFENSMEDLRTSDIRCKIAAVTAGGYLTSLTATLTYGDGTEGRFTADLLGSEQISGEISFDGETLKWSSVVTNDDGYKHVITVTGEDDGYMTVTVSWAPDGTLTVGAQSTQGDAPTLTANLKADEKGFTLKDVLLTQSDLSLSLPLTLTYTPNTAVEAPAETENVFSLSEQDLASLALRAGMKLSAFVR